MHTILEKYHSKSDVIQVLQDTQKKFGFISKDQLRHISTHLDVPYSYLYSITTFYKSFNLEPKGKYTIRICDGTACHIRGSANLLSEVKTLLDVEVGQTTKDGRFSLETVACMGVCALAPVMVIGDEYYGNLDIPQLHEIIKSYQEEDI